MREKTSRTSARNESAPGDWVSEALYREHAAEISLLMGGFFLRYLGHIYREFEGDLAAVLVLGEIGHHNFNECYSNQGGSRRVLRGRVDDPARWERMQPCNAFSLSAATGIPRETVRRKIASLVSRGWLRRTPKGDVFLTQAVPQHFYSEFDLRVLRELLEVARHLRDVLTKSPSKPGNRAGRLTGHSKTKATRRPHSAASRRPAVG